MITFIGQIKSVQSRTAASGDKEFVVKIITEDPKALESGLFSADSTVKVTLE